MEDNNPEATTAGDSALVQQLSAALAARDALVAELRAEVARLKARIRELEARLGQDSSNSSRPPSSDWIGTKRPSGPKPSGRKRGAQPGHPEHHRPMVPADQVDEVVHCWPAACTGCHAVLAQGEDAEVGAPQRHQVHDIEVRTRVTEYQQHTLCCSHCGQRVEGSLPVGVPRGGQGPVLMAWIATLSALFRLSRRDVVLFARELLGVPLSVGCTQKVCEQISAAVAAPVEELAAAVRQQATGNADETSHRHQGKRWWLWTVVTSLGTLFHLDPSRGAQVIRDILGKDFAGVLTTDRYAGYDWLVAKLRQLCWAHLHRNAKGLLALGEVSARVGRGFAEVADAVFAAWADFVAAGRTPEARAALQQALSPWKQRLQTIVNDGLADAEGKALALCIDANLCWPALWNFAQHDGVEPTNNAAERALRRGVLWRKCSLGTWSQAGLHFVSRMLTVIVTNRQHGRSTIEYLTAAAAASIRGEAAPSLLPRSPAEPPAPPVVPLPTNPHAGDPRTADSPPALTPVPSEPALELALTASSSPAAQAGGTVSSPPLQPVAAGPSAPPPQPKPPLSGMLCPTHYRSAPVPTVSRRRRQVPLPTPP